MRKIALLGTFFFFLPAAWPQAPNPAAVTATPSYTNPSPHAVNQRRVDPQHMYHRVYAVVPLIGTGKTTDDPRRPMFAPLPSARTTDHTGIIAYQMHLSDDEQFALVEFVLARPQDLKALLASTTSAVSAAAGVISFEGAKTTPAAIEAEFKKHKKNFTFDMFTTRAQ